MSSASSQLRLLLWKDYLIRKRKPITVGGIVWAAIAIISLVIVRSNVDQDNVPTCQFKARALPSAGLLPFLQSFICTVNNECEALDEYEEIPSYENSRLRLYIEKFRPVIQNETIVETVELLPSAMKLLATATKVMDNPELHRIIRNGIKINDIFIKPDNTKKYLSNQLNISRNKLDPLFGSTLRVENLIENVIVKKNMSCDVETFRGLLNLNETTDINDVIDLLCSLDNKSMKNLVTGLLTDIDARKYLKLIGDIMNNLNTNSSISNLGEMLNSFMRLTDIWNFVPQGLQFFKNILDPKQNNDDKFSYIDKNLVYHVLNAFEQLFNDTDAYKNIRYTLTTIINNLDSVADVFNSKDSDRNDLLFDLDKNITLVRGFEILSKNSQNFGDKFKNLIKEKYKLYGNTTHVFARMAEFIIKLTSKEIQSQTMYYLTLLNKIFGGMSKTISVSLYMEEVLYNVSIRHPGAIKKILQLGPTNLGRIIEGLADANRVQALTRKMYNPDKIFCDTKRLQTFMDMSKNDVESIKSKFCDKVWIDYVTDLIDSFGIYNMSRTINQMASLVIANTLGKDVEIEYSVLDEIFDKLNRLFVFMVEEILHTRKSHNIINWDTVFNDSAKQKQLHRVFIEKSNLSSVALVTVNTALAREIISNNTILEALITPTINKVSAVTNALLKEIDNIPKQILDILRTNLIDFLQLTLLTLEDHNKVLNVLTNDPQEIFCKMVDTCNANRENCNDLLINNDYIVFPQSRDAFNIADNLCNISKIINNKLNSNIKDNIFLNMINSVIRDSNYGKGSKINWNEIISTMQKLTVKINKDVNYVFHNGIDNVVWDSIRNITNHLKLQKTFLTQEDKAIEVGITTIFNIMQVLDRKMFDLDKHETWTKLKNKIEIVNSAIFMGDQFAKLATAFLDQNVQYDIKELPLTSQYLRDLTENLPNLINDIGSLISSKDIDISSFVKIINGEKKWPCSDISAIDIFHFNKESAKAMRSIEELLCVDNELQSEWKSFKNFDKIISLVKNSTMNTNATKTKNIFYETAINFNKMTRDLSKLDNVLWTLYDDINTNNINSKNIVLINAWKSAINNMNNINFDNITIRTILKNIDVLINSTNGLAEEDMMSSTALMLESAMDCLKNSETFDEKCKSYYWNTIKFSVHYVAEAGQQMVKDLNEYFSELLEPDANSLQLVGFTKKTGPYVLYDKLPDFIEVLMNSFLDQGFMKYIHQSIGKQFWDCERLLDNMVIPPNSRIVPKDITVIKPYICPSLVHWVSVPINENVLLDTYSQSQFIFYNKPISNYTSTFEKLFEDAQSLKVKMELIAKRNATFTIFSPDWLEKFKNIGKTLISKNNSVVENMLSSLYVNKGINMIYLTELTNIINHIYKNLKLYNSTSSDDSINEKDLILFSKLLEKRPTEVIETFVYAIAEELKSNKNIDEFNLANSLDKMCKNDSYLTRESMWLKTNVRMVKQFCKTDYHKYIQLFYNSTINSSTTPDTAIRKFVISLKNFEELLNQNTTIDWKMIFNRIIGFDDVEPGKIIKMATKYAHDLGMNSFLHYLYSNIRHYNVILSFVTGENWWTELRQLYNGSYVNSLLDVVEKSPFIIDDVITNISKVKIIRLLKDTKSNDPKVLCNMNLSEYIPDASGLLSELLVSLCNINQTNLFKEIVPLRLAAQIYDDDITIVKEVNEDDLHNSIDKMENKLKLLFKSGTQEPMLPKWLTKENIEALEDIHKRLSSEDSKTNFAFFVLSNMVDATTLITNSTSSSISSRLTPWIKQINLQFIKREEYTTLFCELKDMNSSEIYNELEHNFHWSLALSEVLSRRNYTWIEMNKSMNELLNQIHYYIHDSNDGKLEKLNRCLINTTESKFTDKMALYVTLGSKIMKLIRAYVPYFEKVDGFKTNPTVKYLSTTMNRTVPVFVSLNKILLNITDFKKEALHHNVNEEFIEEFLNLEIDVNKLMRNMSDDIIKNSKRSITIDENALNLYNVSNKYLDWKYIDDNIEKLRSNKYYSFEWFSKIVHGIEKFLQNAGHLVYTFGKVDWNNLTNGKIVSMLDFGLQIVKKDFSGTLANDLGGMIDELHPLFMMTSIEHDLLSMKKGLNSISDFSDEFLSSIKTKYNLSELFLDWDEIKNQIISNTNLTMPVLNEIQTATIDIHPLLSSDGDYISITEYVCNPRFFSTILKTNVEIIENDLRPTLNEISAELCNVNNEEAKEIALIMMQKLNFTSVFDIMYNFMIKQVFKASDVSNSEGMKLIEHMSDISANLPNFRNIINDITDVVKSEPLIASFQNSSSISNLLSNADFLINTGKMMCGKPFKTQISRFYKVIAETKDNIIKPDQRQLDSLPTEYCRDLYKQVLTMGGGKILWTYAKPLLMGKILYTPNNPRINNIINHANESFSQIARLTTLLQKFSEGFASLDSIVEHNASLVSMQKLLESPSIRNLFVKESNESMDFDLTQILNEIENTKNMQEFVSKISKMTGCINLNRFVSVDDEDQMLAKATNLAEINEYMAGVVFVNGDNLNDESVQYKIRMDIDNVPMTSHIKNRFWMPGPDGNFIENLRYFRGFVQLQDLIDKAIISSIDQNAHSVTKRSITDPISNKITDWGIYTQQMPYPCYINDDFKTVLYESQALVVAFFFSLILLVATVVRHLVWERESGNTSLMCVMGMRQRYHTLSWFIASIIEMIATVLVLCLILKIGNILPKSDTILLLIILLNFGLSVISFCYMVTSIFKSASLGAVCSVILYLIFFLPYVIVLSMETILSFPEKIITSLFMSSGFCYTLLLTARLEVQGVGLQWYNFNDSPTKNDPISVANTFIVIMFDALLYACIGWIINYLRFNEKINLDEIKSTSGINEPKIGVRIEHLTKIYKNNKNKQCKALDDVSIDLLKGHITTLLGHNGAGKTTLIKILMGIVKPDSGNIAINKLAKDDTQSRNEKYVLKNHIGLCPQNDVLIELMTSREHLIYYAQLKTGATYSEVKYDVESMIDIMGLGSLSLEPVHRLSGGLRRRLSVGLAFIANPHLVVLDEPSSGVDPVARRDIWSLIVGLKQNRTILLTTHHLDEAELLSDTLIIMHKGKILNSSSPLALKHQYGHGYKLSVTYPQMPVNKNINIFNGALMQTENEKVSQDKNKQNINNLITKYEEADNMNLNTIENEMQKNAKDLLHMVAENIPNANVESVSGNVISINLPFLDDIGQQNDYTKVVKQLEELKPILKYANMSMDCTSLEQVFLNICQSVENDDESVIKTQNRLKPEVNEINISNRSSSSSSISNIDFQPKHTFEKSDFSLISQDERVKGSHFQQMNALLRKRFLHYRRNYRTLIITLFLPAIFVALAMGFSLIRPPGEGETPVNLSPRLYNEFSTEFISTSKYDNVKGKNILQRIMDKSIKDNNRIKQYWTENTRSCECIDGDQKCVDYSNSTKNSILPENQITILPSVNQLIEWIVNTEDIFIEKRYGGWSAASLDDNLTAFTAWYNNKGYHSMPAYVNGISNGILRQITNNSSITTFNHPFKLSKEQLSKSTLLQHIADVGVSIMLLIGYSLIPAAGSIYLVKERTSQEKRLQMLSGVSPFIYWISSLLWDTLIIIIAIILSICVFNIFSLPVYVTRENLQAISLLLLLYGFSCSSLTHIFEKFFNDASLANMIIFCFNVFIGVTGLAILLIIDVLSKSDYVDNIRWTLHKIFLILPQFALGDGLLEISKNSIQATVLARFGMDTYLSPLGWELMGLHYLMLTLTTIVFFLVNIAYEYDLFDKIFVIFQKKTQSSLDADMEDCDVATERYRIELSTLKASYGPVLNNYNKSAFQMEKVNNVLTKADNNDVLQTLSLRKIYSGVLDSRVAVENLTFGVKSGQCFGLLGVNGAGKSTTFKMLTGELRPSNGQIFINGKSVSHRELSNGSIAYCPQADALDQLLTIKEHLEFYCRLRGLQNEAMMINQMVEEFDLSKYVHLRSKALSGGNKRKLCTAIALMGNSPIVLLDEPTSGMDPGARYNVALAVKKAIKAGRCILLSSHSLIECESLCQVVAVTSLGRFLALGPPNYLKYRYGGGYLVSVRLSSPNQKAQLIQSVCEIFPSTIVQNSHYCTTQFLIPVARSDITSNDNEAKTTSKSVKTTLSGIFFGLSMIHSRLDIVDYSVNQSSLDQVFINFSNDKKQTLKMNREIKLSTLERQYSKDSMNNAENGTYVTKF